MTIYQRHSDVRRGQPMKCLLVGAIISLVALGVMASSAAAAPTATPAVVAADLVHGDGMAAATAIEAAGISNNAQVLGNDVIYQGGIGAVAAGTGEQFANAVAYAFPHASVPVLVTSAAFGQAAGDAVATGLTPQEGYVGFITVTRTYAAYLFSGQP